MLIQQTPEFKHVSIYFKLTFMLALLCVLHVLFHSYISEGSIELSIIIDVSYEICRVLNTKPL